MISAGDGFVAASLEQLLHPDPSGGTCIERRTTDWDDPGVAEYRTADGIHAWPLPRRRGGATFYARLERLEAECARVDALLATLH